MAPAQARTAKSIWESLSGSTACDTTAGLFRPSKRWVSTFWAASASATMDVSSRSTSDKFRPAVLR